MDKVQQQIPYQKEIEDVLVEFNKALRALNFYPQGHPALKQVLKKSFEVLMKYLFAQSVLALTVKKDGFYYMDSPFSRQNEIIKGLAQEFFFRQLRLIQILKGITPKEFTVFLKMLTINPDILRAEGGAEKFVFSRGVKGVILNEIHYDMFRLEEDARLKEDDILELGEGLPKEGADDIIQLNFSLTEEENSLLKMLNQLELLKDANNYIKLLKIIIPHAKSLLTQGKVDVAFKALTTITRHFIESKRPKEIKPYISEGLKSIADDKTIPVIVNRLCSNEVTDPAEIINLMIVIGEAMLNTMILRLGTEQNLTFRKRLAFAISKFGERALPRLIPFLNDNRWFVVRNVVAIFGAMGLPQSVPHLVSVLNYQDERVQREIIKTLSKIRAKESIEILLMVLFKSKTELRGYAAHVLGLVRETFAVPYFIKILQGRSLYFEDLKFLEEVIGALGRIGSPAGIEPLIRIFKKRSFFFRKRFRFLKGIVSQAMGEIGGENSIILLFNSAIHEKGEAKDVCLNVLSSMAGKFEIAV